MPTTRIGCLPRRALRAASVIAFTLSLAPQVAVAQTRTLTACTPDALGVCTQLQFGAIGGGLFQLGIRAIGSSTVGTLPIAVYNLVLGTGALIAGAPVSTSVVPVGVGGAVVNDASAWDLFDTGDVLFLSALTNRGVGGCVSGPDADGFGQALTTCGSGQFATFTFLPTVNFDVTQFTILDIEAVGLMSPAQGASCGAPAAACVITSDIVTPPITSPEPATLALVGVGLLAIGAGARRRV